MLNCVRLAALAREHHNREGPRMARISSCYRQSNSAWSEIMAGKRSNESTGGRAASAAAKALRSPNASTAAKSAAGSALTQRRSAEVTGAKAASNAARTLASPKVSKAVKSAAGSALTQHPGKGNR